MKKHSSQFCGTRKTISVICAAWWWVSLPLSLFSRCVILTLRAEHCSLFLSGEVFCFSHFYFLTVRSFIRRIKQRPRSWGASPGACVLINERCWPPYVNFGFGIRKICWKIPGVGEVLTNSFRVRVPSVPRDSDLWPRSWETLKWLGNLLNKAVSLVGGSASFCPTSFRERYHFGLRKQRGKSSSWLHDIGQSISMK